MIDTISWTDYFFTLAIITAVYYLVIGITFYRTELMNLLKRQGHHSDDGVKPSSPGTRIMGKTQPETLSHVDRHLPMDEMVLNEQAPEENTNLADRNAQLLVGVVSDIQQEIKALLEVIDGNNREECAALCHALLSNYPQLISTPYHDSLSLVIKNALKEHFQLDYSINQVKSWWTSNPIVTP